VKAPKNSSGEIYWCVTYVEDIPVKIATGAIFALQTRRAGPITVTITWSVYNFWRIDDIKDAYTDNRKIVLEILLGILAIWLVMTIVNTSKKKEKHTKK
jgi:hypothetical protein